MSYRKINIDDFIKEPVKESPPRIAHAVNGSNNPILAWAEKEIMEAIDGQKHSTLIKVAYTLGGHVGGGTITETEAFDVCFDAICSRDIDDGEAAKRTIKDGLREGQHKPLESNFKGYSQQQFQPNNGKAPEEKTEPEDKSGNYDYVVSGEFLLSNPIETVPTLWDPFLPQKGLGAIGGSSDTGKSTFLRQLGISICAGESSFCGFPLNARHKSALFVLTEDDDVAIRFLLNKQNQGLCYNPEAYRNLRFIFNSENIIEKLAKELERQPADLVVMDAFSDLYEGEMNAGNKVRGFLNVYKEKIADVFNCLVLFLHHTGKRTDEFAPSKHNLIGSQAFEAKMRVVAELRKDQHNSELRHLCFVKGNYLPAEYKEQSYELQFDENMIFRYTGNNVPFDQLAATEPEKEVVDDKLVRVAKAFKMNKEGKKLEDIAEAVGLSNKGAVSKWLNNDKYKQMFG